MAAVKCLSSVFPLLLLSNLLPLLTDHSVVAIALPSLRISNRELLSDSQDFQCPVKDIAGGCEGPKECLYANPDSCYNFFQCTVNTDGVTGTPVTMPCAPGNPPLEWDDDNKVCNYAPSPTCRKGGETQSAETEEKATEGTQPTLPPDSQPVPGFDCAVQDLKSDCLDVTGSDCLYPDPSSCTSYIQCVQLAAFSVPCQSGLEYDSEVHACVEPKQDIRCTVV